MQEAETLLYKHLLLCDKYKDQPTIELGLPEIPWDELIDNAAVSPHRATTTATAISATTVASNPSIITVGLSLIISIIDIDLN
jgi:hypothetical protein